MISCSLIKLSKLSLSSFLTYIRFNHRVCMGRDGKEVSCGEKEEIGCWRIEKEEAYAGWSFAVARCG